MHHVHDPVLHSKHKVKLDASDCPFVCAGIYRVIKQNAQQKCWVPRSVVFPCQGLTKYSQASVFWIHYPPALALL